jgi:hypothetical protein
MCDQQNHKIRGSGYKTDRHDIAEILLKVTLNTSKQTNKQTIRRGDKPLGFTNSRFPLDHTF